ncbi:MAG: CapA family protein [Duncaniella sp.]|nr:CapA family protein [Duncaniella sp.]
MKIAFVGDCVINSPESHKIGNRLRQILSTCDLKAVNFEAPVMYEGAKGIEKSGPVISQSEQTPAWLEHEGFNVISFANNHMLDLHEEGLVKSTQRFKNSIIVGAGTYQNAHEAKGVKVNGENVGFIGVTHKEFGCVDSTDQTALGSADISSPKTFTALADAIGKYDKVYVIAHAGVEYLDYPLPQWREMYKALIDMGAAGVIGSHPHVPQGYEIYKGKPIFYSLGNFAFEKSKGSDVPHLWNSSLLVTVDTSRDEIMWYPLHYDLDSHIIDIDDNVEAKSRIEALSKTLTDDTLYREAMEKIYTDLQTTYKNMAVSGGLRRQRIITIIKNIIKPLLMRKRVKPNYSQALNLFQCESHRWVMERLLKTKKI